MSFQHYLPATYIACFSNGKEPRRRDRVVSIGDRKKGEIREAKSGNVAGINDIYAISGTPEQTNIVDENWSFYEAPLADAFESLKHSDIDAETWGRVIVPFVAGIFVRGPDFTERYTNRLGDLVNEISPDSVNISRVFEFQIMLANLLSSEWIIASVTGNDELITNDLGYAPFMLSHSREIGISIPIGHRHMIQIIPKRKSRAAIFSDGRWIPNLKYVELVRDNHIGFNRALAQYSQHYIFGSTKEEIQKYLNTESNNLKPLEPYQIGFRFGGDEAKYAWYRFISMVSREPTNSSSSNPLDQDALLSAPIPAIMFVSSDLFTHRTTVYRKGHSIYINLSNF